MQNTTFKMSSAGDHSPIPVALIGAGRMGMIHGRNAAEHPMLRLTHVIDPRPAAAAPLAESLNARRAELSEVLDDPAVGGILICSSTDQHLEQALAAMAAGKAVFCEKPIDLDIAKVAAAAHHFTGRPFVLAFNRRFDPHLIEMKGRIDAGAIGALETLHIVNHDPAPPPPGFVPTSGGLFRDFTIHDLDLACWLLDEPVSQVFAAASCLVDEEIGRQGDVDTARTVLKTASGRLCVISNTRRSGYGYDQRVEAFGASGMATAGNPPTTTVSVLRESGGQGAAILPGFMERYAASYRAEMDHFARVLQKLDSPRVGYADGVRALTLADACDLSARSGRVINL
jgi:myo-inositol 2-dehydrogenase / D-chiro-inositol 1-dehydrogenase